MKLRIGLIINPVAGLGGNAGLKGSDGADIQAEARRRGAVARAAERVAVVLAHVAARALDIELFTWDGAMGADVVRSAGFQCRVLGAPTSEATSAADTQAATHVLCGAGVDVLVFAGGDGTARDVLTALQSSEFPDQSIRQLVLGIPAGVKMHSSVFAVTPRAAGEVLLRLLSGGLVAMTEGEVRDIDEAALRAGQLTNTYFGSLRTPMLGHYMQHLKQGGKEIDGLAQQEIAAAVAGMLVPDVCYLLGAGSTVFAIKQQLGLEGSLLGVDAIMNGVQLARDASERDLLDLLSRESMQATVQATVQTTVQVTEACIVLSPTRGQGALFGRGNQQFSPAVIRAAGERLLVVATRGKLLALEGRPLFVDTGDAALDQSLCGLTEVIAGFEDRLLYTVATV